MTLHANVRALLFAAVILAAGGAFAFSAVPKASGKALGVTRGKSFSSGLVFVNGKYLEPPYVVERWGTGIRINGTPVSGQIVDWNSFLRTQQGVKVVRSAEEPTPPPDAAAVAPAPEPAESANDDEAISLDDLFDDDPKPAKSGSSGRSGLSSVRKPVVSVARPRPTVEYALEGEFVPNEASKALLAKVNDARTEIDRILRAGGFVFFGDSYSRVVGDSRTLMKMLEVLPGLLQNSASLEAFRAGVRSASLIYLSEPICEDLYRNRLDYRKLRARQRRLEQSRQWDQALEGIGDSLF
ncbi:MAG: hypothetical protein ACI4RD_01330 [Kiritimatiellia bacterium]